MELLESLELIFKNWENALLRSCQSMWHNITPRNLQVPVDAEEIGSQPLVFDGSQELQCHLPENGPKLRTETHSFLKQQGSTLSTFQNGSK